MMSERLAKSRTRSTSSRHSVALDILVVDDDEALRLSLSFALTDAGHKVTEATDGEQAIALISERMFDVAIVDVRLPRVDGLTLLRRIRSKSPSTSVILMTAFAAVPDAVASLREGAYDYVTKPFDAEQLSLRVIGHIAEHRALRQELEEARKLVASREAGSPIIGHTPAMVELTERINTVAQSDAPVLIHGESGTGKDLVAHTLHARGPRKNAPFVAVSVSAFPEAVIESELFGHAAATSGVIRKGEGRIQAASGGTLLLDAIDALPLAAQAKLVRLLERGVMEFPNGTEPVNVRLLSTTRYDLKELVAKGKFREDLYFAVGVLDLDIPPLRERRADMPLLLAHFLRRYYPGRVPPAIAPRAWSALMDYPFPGNVREFAHAIERAVVLAHGSEIDLEHLPASIAGAATPASPTEANFRTLAVATKEFECQYLRRALQLARSGRRHAAELLGVSSKELWEKLKQHGISDADAPSE